MDSQFVPYELAVKLRELGFNEECLACYFFSKCSVDFSIDWDGNFKFVRNDSINIAAPLWQQAFDWVRKEHGLWSFIDISPNKEFFYTIKFDKKYNKPDFFSGWFETWENARLGCLSRLIKLCE